jgi:hypothetical protein
MQALALTRETATNAEVLEVFALLICAAEEEPSQRCSAFRPRSNRPSNAHNSEGAKSRERAAGL